MTTSRRVIETSEPCRGNTGQWGRTVVYEIEGPLGPMPMVDWEQLPEPTERGLTELERQFILEAIESWATWDRRDGLEASIIWKLDLESVRGKKLD